MFLKLRGMFNTKFFYPMLGGGGGVGVIGTLYRADMCSHATRRCKMVTITGHQLMKSTMFNHNIFFLVSYFFRPGFSLFSCMLPYLISQS
jgi:hypothetical protein